MASIEMAAGNGKSRNKGCGLEERVKSRDLALESSQAKSNLCPRKDANVGQDQLETKTSEELYRALTDKNRAIELLKRRLTNQQIQLGYYLHKNLATEAVLEFSNQCFPHLAEDSTQLSLAMYKFIRDTGGKTRLAQLREKLTDYNNRVHKALLRQEQLVRHGFGFSESEAVLHRSEDSSTENEDQKSEYDDFRFAKKYYKSAKLEMCSQLLSITLLVRKELERFRACADNVVKLEEERNALVDKVFTLPADQRYGTVHIAMVDHVCQIDSTASQRSITSVSTSTNTINDVDGKAIFNNFGGALQDMESEAIQLLLLSEKQQNEFVIALEEARVENQQLRERLRDLEEAASDERVMQLQEKCNNIEKEVDIMKKEFEAEQTEKEQAMQQMTRVLSNKDVKEQNTKLEIKELKACIDKLRKERDSLEKNLKHQRLIDQMNQNTSTDDMLDIQSDPVSQQDVNDLTDLVVMQEEQIKDLLSIMSDLNVDDDDSNSSDSSIAKKSSEEKSTKDNPPESVPETEPTNDSGILSHTKTDINQPQRIEVEEPHEEYHIYYDSASDFSNQEASEDGRIVRSACPVNAPTETHQGEKDVNYDEKSKKRPPRTRSLSQRRFFGHRLSRHKLEKHREGLAKTSLTVQSFDKDGTNESMHAVLECTAPVDGLLEMNNASKLHLRLQCTSPQRSMACAGYSESSQYFEKHSGDFSRTSSPVANANNEGRHLSREARMYLSKQLNKIKSQLGSSQNSIHARKEIVQNLNEIYSQLFGTDDECTTQSTRS